MKKDIHPKYHTDTKVTCACGNTFTTGSTKEKLEIEICSNCHPFFTGKQKLIDTAGVVDKFRAKLAKQEAISKSKQTKKSVEKPVEKVAPAKTVKDKLAEARRLRSKVASTTAKKVEKQENSDAKNSPAEGEESK